ncbi:MAG: MFS transporter [Phycisphaerae bacterium]|nr:MFS transporter [Phycisphaerae bacterium]
MKRNSTRATSQFKRELLAWAFLPMMLGAIEGGVVGILTKRLFEGTVDDTVLDWSVGALAAAQGFANISSFMWAALSHGKHKIQFITALKIVAVLMIGSVAFIPISPVGLGLLLCCVVGTRICWTGVVTLRTTVWQANYPRSSRTVIAGKIYIIQALVLAVVSFSVGEAMKIDENAFRWVYPIAASFGIIGAWIYSKIRVVNHKELLREEISAPEYVSLIPWRAFKLLIEDKAFAKYMSCQFILGVGNLMLTAPLILVLSDSFTLDVLEEILIVSTVPILMIPWSTPLWAKLLDNMHVLTFRAIHSWFFVASSLCFAVSIAFGFVPGLWIGAVIRGIAFGGGVLAWNLGHQDYAPVEQSGRYMGLHVTLTGIRGLFAPALGVALYTALLSQNFYAGPIVFSVGAGLSALGGIGFILLSKERKNV